MNTNDIISSLSSLNEQELVKINSILIDHLRLVRHRKTLRARSEFSTGDSVSFGDAHARGKRSLKTGEIVSIKRTRAVVLVGKVQWTVPLNMLKHT